MNKEIYEELLRKSKKKLIELEERKKQEVFYDKKFKENFEKEIEETKAEIFSYKLSIDLINDIWYLS